MNKLFFLFTFLVCFSSSIFAAKMRVTGLVTDSDGPVPGILVLEHGTNNGVVTDVDGKYIIYCEHNATLYFDGIGYELTIESVNSRPVINVVMKYSDDLIIVTPSNVAMADAFVILTDKMIFDDKIRQSYSPVSA